jgi:hypothetical protein
MYYGFFLICLYAFLICFFFLISACFLIWAGGMGREARLDLLPRCSRSYRWSKRNIDIPDIRLNVGKQLSDNAVSYTNAHKY